LGTYVYQDSTGFTREQRRRLAVPIAAADAVMLAAARRLGGILVSNDSCYRGMTDVVHT